MSYTRPGASGHYIYGDGENVNFNGFPVTDDEIDVFIHELYGDSEGGGAEFWERFYHGRRIIENFQKGIEVKRYYKYSDKIETAAKTAAALACEIWREHYTPIIGAEQVEYMLAKFQSSEQIYEDMAKNDYVYFIAECVRNAGHHVPIGYCAGQPKEEYLFLSKLYVRKDYRGRGIARSFIEESAALCRWKYGFTKPHPALKCRGLCCD